MFTTLAENDLQRGEIFGVPAALIVLVVVFGAVLAATMPLVLSIISIILALALTALIGQIYPTNIFVLNILTMMGLAVGIDYTLFVISRYREERARGLEKIEAIAATGATANRAIFFSGMTVVLAMIGMVIVPIDIMIGMGIGVMLVVFTTLLTALIALPAVMSVLGDRINALRVPFLGRAASRRANGHGGVWERLAHSIMRRPVVWLSVAVVALLAIAAPVLVMNTGSPTQDAALVPDGHYAKQGWDMLDRDFSLGQANPLQIVVDGPASASAVEQGIASLQQAMKEDGRFAPVQVTVNEAGDLTLLTTALAGDPVADSTQALVQHLRNDMIPAAFAGSPAQVYVTGTTAGVVDYLGFFDTWLPIVLLVVLSLSFVLLLVAFRSIVIPAQAILMNLLSVGASYGLLVLVFQKGVGAELLGLTQVESIEAWVPLMLFALLFGLSMDYQVFLLSRIKERFDHSGDTREAVGYGVGRTGEHHHRRRRHHGLRLRRHGDAASSSCSSRWASASPSRSSSTPPSCARIVVPAAMELLGDWNWYLPRWLEWLPNVSIEGRVDEHVPAGDTPAPAPRAKEPVAPPKVRRPFPRTAPGRLARRPLNKLPPGRHRPLQAPAGVSRPGPSHSGIAHQLAHVDVGARRQFELAAGDHQHDLGDLLRRHAAEVVHAGRGHRRDGRRRCACRDAPWRAP